MFNYAHYGHKLRLLVPFSNTRYGKRSFSVVIWFYFTKIVYTHILIYKDAILVCTLIICLIISIKSGNENFLKIMILYKPKINMFSYSFTSKKYNFLETFT